MSWEDKLLLCREYEESHNMITRETEHCGIKIGIWLHLQQEAIYGRKGKMTENRREQLFKLVTIQEWYKNRVEDFKWMNIWKLCYEYEQTKGIIKSRTKHEDVNIGFWIDTQKQAIQGKGEGKMNENRFNILLNSRTFHKWYINNQHKCHTQFREFHFQSDQQIILNELPIQFETSTSSLL